MSRHPTPRGPLLVLFLLLVAGAHFVGRGVAFACRGTPTPTCTRTIWLGKFAPRTVVMPRRGPIRVPVGLLPFVVWSTTPPCAQPASASLQLTLTCTPVGGGLPVVFGPQNFPVPTPTTPGAQPLPGPVTFTIPAGSLPRTIPHVCTVAGTYTVTFGPGSGSGALSGTGDTEICLVTPAPGDPSLPRLQLEHLSLAGEHFARCRRGDQGILYYLVTNNDPRRAVTLDLTSDGRQTAILPDGFTAATAYAGMAHAISATGVGEDIFPTDFADTLGPFELLPEGDPHIPPPPLGRALVLPPLGGTIVALKVRSYGMCANGSCNERALKVTGTFADGRPALGCAGTAFLVDEVPAKSALCEFSDHIKTSDMVRSFWGPGVFNNPGGTLEHASTFSGGNQPPGDPIRTEIDGLSLMSPGVPSFPALANDYLRITEPATRVSYDVLGVLPGPTPVQVDNGVQIFELGTLDAGQNIELPLIHRNPPVDSVLDIIVQLTPPQAPDQLFVFDRELMVPLFQGSLEEFKSNPPPGLSFDPGTCRRFGKSGGFELPRIATDPLSLARLLTAREARDASDTVQVLIDPPNPGATWQATLAGKGAVLKMAAGPISTPIPIGYSTRRARFAPESNIAILTIEVAGAINSPLRLPILTRFRRGR